MNREPEPEEWSAEDTERIGEWLSGIVVGRYSPNRALLYGPAAALAGLVTVVGDAVADALTALGKALGAAFAPRSKDE